MYAATAKSLQSCPTLCDPIDGSPPGSPVPGILQARTLEWVAISFSNAWKWKVKVKSLSRVRLLTTPWTVAHQAPPSTGFSRQEYWSGVPLPFLCMGRCKTVGLWRSLLWYAPQLSGANIPSFLILSLLQFSSVAQSYPTLCNPMDCSMTGLPVHHQLPEFTQTHVHWFGDGIQPSHPLLFPSPPAFNLSQHQGLFKWVSSSHQVAKVLEFQLQYQSFQWTVRTESP